MMIFQIPLPILPQALSDIKYRVARTKIIGTGYFENDDKSERGKVHSKIRRIRSMHWNFIPV